MSKILLHSETRSVFKASPFPSLLLSTDPQFTIAEVSRTFLEATGTSEQEVIGKGFFDVLQEHGYYNNNPGVDELRRSLQQVLDIKSPQNVMTQTHDKSVNGSEKANYGFCTTSISPVVNDNGEIEFLTFTSPNLMMDDFSRELDKASKQESSTVVKQKPVGDANNEVLHLLQERIKEQSCLYRISSLNEQELSIDQLLKEAVAILPSGWQYSDIAEAAIEFDGTTYATPGYRESKWTMSSQTEIRKGCSLVAKVVYPEMRSGHNEELFLKEEQDLIDSVINHLSLKIDQVISQQELEEKQQLLDKAYQLARIGTWEFNMLTHELYWSPVTKEVHGFGQDYEPDLESTIKLFKEGVNREIFEQAAWNAIENEEPFDVELKIISGLGDERWIRATGEPEYKDGVCTRFYGISQNVSDRRQAEEDLHLSEQRFRSLVQDGSDLIAILDSDANYTYVSPTSESILGIPADDFIGTNALNYIHEEDKEMITDLFSDLSTDQRINFPAYRFRDAEGNWRWMETSLTNMMEDPAVGGMVANSRDVTEQIKQQHQNQEALREKETLLAEIHHRVKNNLAVVSGMMQLQVSEDNDSELTDRLMDSIIRIKTMANIHEQLYQSNSFSKLAFADNIQSLVLNILKTFRSKTEVDIDFNCEPVQLNINQAIPCSLIVNEVATNIFKHAFPGRKKGTITISLHGSENNNSIQLSIRDNGVGLPDDFDSSDTSSLGLNLIDVLSQQLAADYKYESCNEGTLFTIRFKKDEFSGIGNGYLA